MTAAYNEDLTQYLKRYMFKTGLSEVKPDFSMPHPTTNDYGTPNISKLRKLMHLA